MNENDDLSAAYHILGLLLPDDEARVAKRMALEPEFAAAVTSWAERLDALDAPDEVAVPDRLWSEIERSIDDTNAAPGTRTVRADDGIWETLGPGIQRRLLYVDRVAGTQTYYVRMTQGAVLPQHAHVGTEQCVLLEGKLRVGETTFDQGDFHIGFSGEDHLPITAVTDALFFIHGAL